MQGTRHLLREAAQQWRQLAPDQQNVGQGVRILSKLIFDLRRQGDRATLRKVLDRLASTPLGKQLADHRWAYNCERVCDQLISEQTWPDIPSQNPRAPRIELFGPPGSGKSTITNRLLTLANSRGIELIKKWQIRHLLTQDHFDSSARKFKVFLDAVERARNSKFNSKYVTYLHQCLALLTVGEEHPHLNIMEEGLMQCGINLAHSMPLPHEVFLDYFTTLPAPTAVIIPCSTPEQILRRNQHRGVQTQRRDLSDDMFFTIWVVEVATKILAARGIPIIYVRNDDESLESACNEALAGIKALPR